MGANGGAPRFFGSTYILGLQLNNIILYWKVYHVLFAFYRGARAPALLTNITESVIKI